MNYSIMIRALAGLAGAGALAGTVLFAIGHVAAGLIALLLMAASGIGLVVLLERRNANMAATHQRYIRSRIEALVRDQSSLATSVASLEGAVSALRDAIGGRYAAQPGTPASITQEFVPQRVEHLSVESDVHSSTFATGSGGFATLLTLGRPLGEVAINSRPTTSVLPGAIPLGATVGSAAAVVVDEEGFAHGVWKSFGADADEFLMSELERLRRIVREKGIPVYTLRAAATPEHLQSTRNWGFVVDSVAEVDHLLSH